MKSEKWAVKHNLFPTQDVDYSPEQLFSKLELIEAAGCIAEIVKLNKAPFDKDDLFEIYADATWVKKQQIKKAKFLIEDVIEKTEKLKSVLSYLQELDRE